MTTPPADTRGLGAVPWPGEQRVGVLEGLPALVRELGIAGERLAEVAGVPLAKLADREAMIPFVAMGRLFAAARDLTGRDEIGLLLGQRTDTIAALGLIGRLMRQAPDLGAALEDLAIHQRRYVNGSVIYLLHGHAEACLGYAVHWQAVDAIPQILDAAMAAGANLLRGLGGFAPVEVQIARPLPADPAIYRRVCGAPVRFDAAQSALTVSARDLARPIPGARPERRRRLEAEVEDWWATGRPDITAEVARILRPRVVWGAITLDATAGLLGLHPRALERRLRDTGTSYRRLLGDVRLEVAGQLLRGTRMSVTSVSDALGYADPSAFNNWFRRETGETPARWRTGAGAFSPARPGRENNDSMSETNNPAAAIPP